MRSARHKPPGGRWLLLAASLVAAGSLAAFGVPRIDRWRLERDARVALGALLGCLCGPEGPDAAADADILRRRAIAAQTTLVADGPWPARCTRHAGALDIALGSLRRAESSTCADGACCPQDTRCQRLAEARGLAATLRTELERNRVRALSIAAVQRSAAECGLGAESVGEAPLPPAPATLVRRSAVVAAAEGIRELATDPATAYTLTVALHGGRGTARLCELELDPLASPRCSDIGHLLPDGSLPLLLGREEGASLRWLVAPHPAKQSASALALIDARSATVQARVPGKAVGGYVWADGMLAFAVTDPSPERVVLWRATTGSALRSEPILLPPDLTMGPAVVADQLLWVAPDRDGTAILWAMALRPGAAAASARVRVGPVGALDPSRDIESCRSGGVTAVVLRAPPEGHRSPVALAWLRSAEWLPIQRQVVPSPSFGVGCVSGSLSLGWTDTLSEMPSGADDAPSVTGRYLVGRLGCTPAGCTEQRAELPMDRFSASSRWIFADAGSHASVIWRGPLGDVRYRSGPLSDLEQARDQPLFDDEAHDGFAWELGAGSTVVRAGTTVLLGRTTESQGDRAYLLAIDRNGAAHPLQPVSP